MLHKVLVSKNVIPSLRHTVVQSIMSADSRSASVVDSNVSLLLHVAVRNEANVDNTCRSKIVDLLMGTYSAALLMTDLAGHTPLHITCEELPRSESDMRKLMASAPNAARIWNSTGSL